MKSFALSAAILASAVAALPTSILPNGASGVLPPTLPTPSCAPSGVSVSSGVPSSVSVAANGYNAEASAGSAQVSTGEVTSQVYGTASDKVDDVLSVTDEAGKMVQVELEPTVARLLGSLHMGSIKGSVGQIIQVAPTIQELHIDGATGGLITVATHDGSVALVKLNAVVEDLLSSLGLSQAGSLVGSIVGHVEDVVSGVATSVKRGLLSEVMTVTDLHVGTVVAEVPAVSDLTTAAKHVAANPNQLFGVLGQDGVSALLVKVDSTSTGLLSMLGLSSLTSTVGSVVPAGLL
ncbi:hypothetical protein POX_g08778 [Penicillium oxalicum]|uniref:hypothetical protein n=1 Tax=Penicillium oxalicum TaxID=69781 RepID=UPI0020B6D3DB|nr:hypothetical protein POX_g08778 [Penicillium oxalicum]KAI2786393.1 hypothetical protein POX_g08778 [Penicillium oxalicum]